MTKMKLSVCALSVAMLLSSCGGMTNTAKGGLIGGAGGGALGALVGQFIGKGKGAAIGAAVGTAVGAGAGILAVLPHHSGGRRIHGAYPAERR